MHGTTTLPVHARNLAATRIIAICALLAFLFFAPARRAAAHDIPSDATVQMFFKPDGNHLNILVRVPLKTMRDVEFPERGRATWILTMSIRRCAKPRLLDSNFIDVYEGDTRLPKPRVAETRLSLESDPSFMS